MTSDTDDEINLIYDILVLKVHYLRHWYIYIDSSESVQYSPSAEEAGACSNWKVKGLPKVDLTSRQFYL